MLDRARELVRGAVYRVTGLLSAAWGAVLAWIHGDDTSFMVVMGGVAIVLLVLIVMPGRRRD